MNFSDKLKELRIKNHETQQELADKLSISFQSVSKWEKGICLPTIDLIKEIATHYNVTLDSLLFDDKNIEEIEYKTHSIEYRPTVNKESYFSAFIEEDHLYPARLAEGRYRTDASHNHRASDDKNSYVIAVNSLGKIIYMALGTGHCMGSPCDPFYHPKEIVEAKNLDCFYLLDTYRPFGDGTENFTHFEFIIPKNGFVITINNNSYEIRNLFDFLSKGINPGWIDFRRFKFGELDQFTFSFHDGVLTISYQETGADQLKKNISSKVFKELFEDYIKNNKNEILSILKDDVIDSLRDDIEVIQYDAEEALNMAEEALSMMMGKKN